MISFNRYGITLVSTPSDVDSILVIEYRISTITKSENSSGIIEMSLISLLNSILFIVLILLLFIQHKSGLNNIRNKDLSISKGTPIHSCPTEIVREPKLRSLPHFGQGERNRDRELIE